MIDEGEVVTNNGTFELNFSGVEDIKTRGQNIGEILPWYDNKFLTFGSYGLDLQIYFSNYSNNIYKTENKLCYYYYYM